MQFSDADIDSILSVTGEDAILTPALEVAKTIRVKFRRNGIDQMGVQVYSPMITSKESDWDGIDHRTAVIEIDGVTYMSTHKLPDGAGFVELHLTRDF